jgi:predicted RecA/RadA family phage recombinase
VSNYEYSTDNGTSWTARFPASYLSPLIITGLTNSITYALQIRAINSIGTSCPSLSASVTPALGSVPDAPTNLVVTPINSGGMIQFTTPTNDRGSSITNYEYSIDGGSNWNTPSPAITTSPLIISSGLTNCTSYQLQLRAVNISGSGAASLAATLVPSTSTDFGSSWSQRFSAANNGWLSVTYGNGLFVAVSNNGTGNRVMTSPDGITWTSRPSAADLGWTSVTYGNGLFVAVAVTGSGNRVMTSPDGITWTSRTSAADNDWLSVTYGNGLFVAVSITGTGNRVMTSPDGTSWTSRTSATDNNWYSVTYGNGLFVAVATTGTGNRVMTSPDGITWTARTSAADNQWRGVTYGNGLFVAVAQSGTGNRVMTSPDGIIWTIRTSASDNTWQSVTYGNGKFVAVANGTGNRVMTSPDGITWTFRISAADNAWRGIVYGNGLFVAVSDNGTGNRVMTSSYNVVADVPVISSVTVSQTGATVSFTQSIGALAPAITNYRYSIDNGANWTTLSPASTTSPITVTAINDFTNQIQLQAINSVGNSCAAIYAVAFNLNKYGQKTSTGSDFVNKNGALGISGIRSTGESRTFFPVLSATAAVIDITTTTATSGGTVGADGGASVTARGVCWSTTTNPTTLDSKTVDGTGTGIFTSAITGLTSGTTYYVRSYATNSIGTTYGPEVSFTTL